MCLPGVALQTILWSHLCSVQAKNARETVSSGALSPYISLRVFVGFRPTLFWSARHGRNRSQRRGFPARLTSVKSDAVRPGKRVRNSRIRRGWIWRKSPNGTNHLRKTRPTAVLIVDQVNYLPGHRAREHRVMISTLNRDDFRALVIEERDFRRFETPR